ncbi:translation initiation factor IF-2-like [Drosophila subpulchrella]|uniref:translation initiation factor IF-2-like n=1 Tax=Drosophila subpulchrella TaxID=1486046 RepID=UPI0018A16D2C|nr:translation initiation factor IF-2-like [Drosophila subpulchrella]
MSSRDPARGKDGRQPGLPEPRGGSPGRIPTGAAEVEWASEEPPQDQQAPSSHAESVAAATLEFRRKCEARRRSEEQPLKEMEESPEWQAQPRTAEEEEQQLWENPGYPPTPRYAPEPCIPPPEVAEALASSPPRWLPEIPPTPWYEGSPQWILRARECSRSSRIKFKNKRIEREFKTGIGRETRLKQGPEERGIHGSSGIQKFTLG